MVRTLFHSQRGALFGMDARIAMAIFASMTVVIGYFAFGKIDMAKNSALLRELEAVHSAIQDYQTDMGTFYQFTVNASNGANDFAALYDVNYVAPGFQKYWNGPYYSPPTNTHPVYGSFTITYGQADHTAACTSTSDCFSWIGLSNVPEKIWTNVNSFVDEAWGSTPEGPSSFSIGNVQADNNTNPRTLFYKSVSRKK